MDVIDRERPLTELQRECIRRIAEAKQVSPDAVGLDATLDSLAVDSLDRVTLSFDLEEQYGVEIPEAELHRIQTVGDVAAAVERALAKKERGSSGTVGGA